MNKQAISFGNRFINPFSKKSIKNQIITISIWLSVIYLISFIKNISLIGLIITDPSIDLSVIEFLLPFVLFPIALILFLKKKKLGWILINGLLFYQLMGTFFNIIFDIKLHIEKSPFAQSLNSYWFHFILILIMLPFFIFINKKAIINYYNISRQNQLWIIGVIVIILSFIWLKIIF